jgi:hypothetical protein
MKPAALTLARTALVSAGIVLCGVQGAQAQELGRLFFTPEQRAALDARRKARVPDKPAAAPVTESPITRVDGAVLRSGGKSTVWVDGEMIPEGAQPGGARVAPRGPARGRVSVPAGDSTQRQDLRVGESLDRNSGEVRDVIGDGEIRIGPRRAAPRK